CQQRIGYPYMYSF
nr:immunoglobulin light chain junction region [Macaca mulatta]MOV78801.1 immunoglobulin light chain junction region [Macaca mulatta]MOV81727.1 immunoglobulin light chain junction region [Macaca mulatta]MOV82013.1 immunoglobulin light chain junction region [Macaca mulatta]MOV82406.1 immunoglobulin light chain junction region [Macaca mulatta]